MRATFPFALIAVLATASSSASELPKFHQLSSNPAAPMTKPLAASPVAAPVKTVLTATLHADGKVITQCRTEHDHAIDRPSRLEQKQ
ncbi:MAG: hypothetical protein COS34_04680 [Lysobacterales bacterium CG02_land_8_20_14_3_00_62_12]|nr:MAG: hypothetical protein COS34_04680 [Xanthomonadales bacterium CG02_land_8_20_14_3_00_62_12]PJA41382.1 MAG: hypothetical protein CO182_06785 [Xanthomonadales bacterium CG_4_9_14_3_um_filter_62_6]